MASIPAAPGQERFNDDGDGGGRRWDGYHCMVLELRTGCCQLAICRLSGAVGDMFGGRYLRKRNTTSHL